MAVSNMVMPAFANAEQTADYARRAASYHRDQADLNGCRLTTGAELLGLEPGHLLTRNQHIRLMLGQHPTKNGADGAPLELIKRKGPRSPGEDRAYSAPKSVSIEIGINGNQKLLAAHRSAADEAHAEFIKQFIGHRKRPGPGKDPEHIHTGRAITITVTDGVNRNNEPHEHDHKFTLNMTTDDAGNWRAVDFNAAVKSNVNLCIDAIYRAKLRNKCEALGLKTENKQGGLWELTSVSDEVIDFFSTRHAEIRKAKAAGHSDETAFMLTRNAKENKHDANHADEIDRLRAQWRERARALHASTPAERTAARRKAFTKWDTAVTERTGLARVRPTDPVRREIVEVLRAAEIATQADTFTNDYGIIARLITERANNTGEVLDIELARAVVKKHVDAGVIREITRETAKGYEQKFYTTWDMYIIESKIMERTAAVGGRDFHQLTENLEQFGKNLSTDQRAIIPRILNAETRARCLQGDPGAGKTTTMDVLRRAVEAEGYTIRGAAVASIAAEKLETESGIKSDNLETELRKTYKRKDAPDFLVVDEANTVSSNDWFRLMKHAEQHDIIIIAVGDENQLRPIGSGKIFERLVERARATGTLAELKENFRQLPGSGLVEMVDLLKQKNQKAKAGALALLEKQKRLHAMGNVDAQLDLMAKMYEWDGDTLIIAGTRAFRDEIGGRIRARAVASGKIKSETARTIDTRRRDEFGDFHTETLTLAVGDRVRLTKNWHSENLKNGTRAEVLTIDADSVTVKILTGGKKRTQKIDLRVYNFLEHDYCVTLTAAEGQTADKCAVWLGTDATSGAHFTNARNFYVAGTRARRDFHIFTDSRKKLFELATQDAGHIDTMDDKEITVT